ncbi:MAG: DNA polymerase I, partial [Dehalococcoidia bacterium]|nr:DNA polymerase I [Dehalococcoidia bacterium]
TLSLQAQDKNVDVVIVTGDADAMQLVSSTVKVLTSRRGMTDTALYGEEDVRTRYGVNPAQIADLKGLSGDTSDNIPGVPGIGDKTAGKLIGQFGSVEGIYERLAEVTPPRIQEILRKNEEVAHQSKRLATIVRDVPITLELEACRLSDYDRDRVRAIFQEVEFRSLLDRLPGGSKPPRQAAFLFGEDEQAKGYQGREAQLSLFAVREAPAVAVEDVTTTGHYRIINTLEALDELVVQISKADFFVFDTETTSLDAMQAALVGISISVESADACYIPVGHSQLGSANAIKVSGETLESSKGKAAPVEQLERDFVLARLKPILENAYVGKIAHNAKYDASVLANYGIETQPLEFDTMLAAYLLNEKAIGLKDLAYSRLGVEMTPITTLIGKGGKQVSMAEVDVEVAAAYACADAGITARLHKLLAPELREKGLWQLFHEVEMPLVPVLVAMEREGIALDTGLLRDLSQDLTQQMQRLEVETYNSVGHQFNINSTKQLGAVLFDELKLPTGRKIKTGYSTDASALEYLKGAHPVIEFLLEYRQLSKLKSTYVDALPALINPRTGRLHTSFNQAATTTGRLSSSDPNLQNIPIRTEIGRRVRQAFVPGKPDWLLLSADYSQVELRLLAHITQDPNLLAAFQAGEDIHAATASQVFGTPIDQVSSNMRRVAKVVNFGVIYGMSDYGLSQGTDLSRSEAGQFIEAYFQRYIKVKEYLEDTKKQARRLGYVQTLLNRRRYIPEINSPNAQIRQAAERMAINMPVQGTAADIIKIAMVRLYEKLRALGLRSKMLLQVHDELVLEMPADEVAVVAALVRETMEAAFPISVLLKVDVGIGPNWNEMKEVDCA